MTDVLTNKNYVLFCAKNYHNAKYLSMEEFREDLSRIKYVKKLLTRYAQTGDLKTRLILNHLIILNNAFGPEALVKMIFLKMKNQLRYVKPFLLLLSICPNFVYNVEKEGNIINVDEIEMDNYIMAELRKI